MAQAYSREEMREGLVATGIGPDDADLLLHIAEEKDDYTQIHKRMGVRPRDD